MKQFPGFLSAVLISIAAVASANAEEKPSRKKVQVDFFWTSDLTATGTSDVDRSLNEGRDAFRVLCDHAKQISSGSGHYGCGANVLWNHASFDLYDQYLNGSRVPTGATFDLFAGRTASLEKSGLAFGARVRIPVARRWDAVLGMSQGRTTTVREEAFRDYARVDFQDPTYWFFDASGIFGGGFHSVEMLHLSRHYREESAAVRYRSRTLSVGGEYLLVSRGRLQAVTGGGIDIRLNRSDGERTVRDYDYNQFLPDSDFRSYFGLPPLRLQDARRPAGPAVSERYSKTDVQLLPYLGARLDVRLVGRLSVTSGVRWYPTIQETFHGQESILDPYSTLTRSERFTFTAGTTLAF